MHCINVINQLASQHRARFRLSMPPSHMLHIQSVLAVGYPKQLAPIGKSMTMGDGIGFQAPSVPGVAS